VLTLLVSVALAPPLAASPPLVSVALALLMSGWVVLSGEDTR
jgi:hypothetical protein